MNIFITGCQSNKTKKPNKTTNTSLTVPQIIGIDISKYQGKVNFKKVKASGITYVFIRATEGITYQDVDFKSNIAAARAAGLVVGAYHFYETNDAPAAQLNNFKNMASLQSGDLPPVIDIEKLHNNDSIDLTKNIQIFVDGLESYYGVKPIIYSGYNFANKYMKGFGGYPLWLAEYEVTKPNLPEGWSDWTFWQWSQSNTVDGLDGNVDADRYNGSKASFDALLIK